MGGSARCVYVIWLCFVARVFFYAAALPTWEGYDEWRHFAVIRLVALRGQMLPPRDSPLPRDVGASLNLVPLPWSWRQAAAPSLPHDEFWQLPAERREARLAAFRELPRAWQLQDTDGPYRAHEAFQPPLYYWTMAPLMLLLAGARISTQLVAMRWFGALVGSFAIPLAFLIARQMLGSARMALGCAAVLALMPGFALVVGHAGNDSLAIPLFSLLIWSAVRIAGGHTGLTDRVVLGVSLGLGLLTKAYFLTAIPALAVLVIWRLRTRAVLPAACALLAGGWWYARAYLQTGALTGLTDFVMASSRTDSLFSQMLAVPWGRAFDSILFSHIYAGGWSFLQVRSWIYHLFYAVMLLAALGLLRVRRTREMLILAALYASFWLGELYHVVILWAARGVATSMGYYLYGVVAAEVPLCAAGLASLWKRGRGAWVTAAGAILFAALDLFAMHAIAIPYYTGLIRHKPNGALAAFHLDALQTVGLGEVLRRVAEFHGLPIPAVLLLWMAYVAATLTLVRAAIDSNSKPRNKNSAAGFATY
jgi:4-amino-4-deoxy-L-arabinose transferase-like glycosyltransferase